jgi:hypothetical protein
VAEVILGRKERSALQRMPRRKTGGADAIRAEIVLVAAD